MLGLTYRMATFIDTIRAMKNAILTFVLVAIAVGVIGLETSMATEYYVATHGDDSNNGLTPDTAWKTITHALSQTTGTAANPHTIHVAAGTYSASATGEIFPLTMKSFVSLQGAGAEMTVLDAEHRNNDTVIMVGLFVSGMFIDGFTIRGGQSELAGAGIWCQGENRNVTISNNVIRDNSVAGGGAIAISSIDCYACIAPRVLNNIITENRCFCGIVCAVDSLEAKANVVSQNEGGGIYNEGLAAFIEDNWIEKNASTGIQCNRYSTISGNLISGNSGAGIQIGVPSLVINNIVKDNGEAGISLGRYASAVIGGSRGNGNDIYGHRWHELYGVGDKVIDAQYNYFGVPAPTSTQVFPFDNFDVSKWRQTSIIHKGDVNRDEVINVLDIVLTINFIIYNLRPTPLHFMAADLNEDERIDVLDVVKIVNAILYPR